MGVTLPETPLSTQRVGRASYKARNRGYGSYRSFGKEEEVKGELITPPLSLLSSAFPRNLHVARDPLNFFFPPTLPTRGETGRDDS